MLRSTTPLFRPRRSRAWANSPWRAGSRPRRSPTSSWWPRNSVLFGMDSRGSHRRVRDAVLGLERIAGGFVKAFAFRQHDRRRAHGVGGRIDAVGLLAVGDGARRFAQTLPRHDDAVVGRDQVFFAAVLDRPGRFLDRGVLHGDAFYAGIGFMMLLRHAVDQIVVVFVDYRAERAGNEIDVDAAAIAHHLELMRRQRPRRMMREAP